MPGRSSAPFRDLVLRSPPNWLAVVFLGILGCVHLSVAIPSLLEGRWQGYLSIGLGSIFVSAAGVASRIRYEMAVLPSERRVRLRQGLRRLASERSIPFAAIRGVRLTLAGTPRHPESRIELLAQLDDIECPPTDIPRQQALFLAMAIGVPLTKVMDEELHDEPPADRAISTSGRTERA